MMRETGTTAPPGRARPGDARGAALRGLFVAATMGLSLWGSAAAGSVSLSGDARVGCGYDSNALEYVSGRRRVADAYALTEAGVTLRGRGSGGLPSGPSARMRWAVERFHAEREETRQALWAELGWRWSGRENWLACSWNGAARLFPSDSRRDVGRHVLASSARLRLSPRARLLLDASGVLVSTQPDGPSARRGWILGGEYWRTLTQRWQLFGRLERGGLRYERKVQGACPPGNPIGPFDHQTDKTVALVVGAARSAAPLLQFSYGLRMHESNAPSSDLIRHIAELQAGWMLPAHLSLQILCRLHATRYANEECIAAQPDEDSEDPDLWERNSVVLQLTRPLGHGLAAELRGSWQRNEALISGRYYEKTMLTGAIRYGFGWGD